MPRDRRVFLTPRGSQSARGGSRARWGGAGGELLSSVWQSAVGFTLADEARQTSQQDHSFWSQNSKLRNKPVSFIKSGPLKQHAYEASPPPSVDAQQHGHATGRSQDGVYDASPDDSDVIGPEELDKAIEGATQGRGTPPTLVGPAAQSPAAQSPAAQGHDGELHRGPAHVSPESSSDHEIILFRGRNRNPPGNGSPKTATARVHAPSEDPGGADARPGPPDMLPVARANRRGRGRRGRRGRGRNHENTSDDPILDDYIANMRESGEIGEIATRHVHARADPGGTDTDTSGHDSPWPDETKGHSGPPGQADAAVMGQGTATLVAGSHDGADGRGCESESEADDEALAGLIAGQSLGPGPGVVERGNQRSSSYSDSNSDEGEHGSNRSRRHRGFDPMDWEQPSRRRKGRKANGPGAHTAAFDVCDSELEQRMQAAWKTDRLKKKQRKAQREELRALGLLGQKTSPGDLRVKYPTGMSKQEVVDELKNFLTGMHETLSFPPMDNHARKLVHELASRFRVKSKSTGKADERRPTLYRTARTLPYVQSTFEQAAARIYRPYLPRPDAKGKRGPGETASARGSHAAASYRDGEVVGAAAPELGTGNRGRAMLEKMGWSSGTALGATHNKGILQPVTQTMKRSKAGLG